MMLLWKLWNESRLDGPDGTRVYCYTLEISRVSAYLHILTPNTKNEKELYIKRTLRLLENEYNVI